MIELSELAKRGIAMAEDCLERDLAPDELQMAVGIKAALESDGRISMGAFETLRSLWVKGVSSNGR